MMAAEAEIRTVVQNYLDGLYHCDTQRLAVVFHPQALYATAADGVPLILGMPEYFSIVEKRDPPARRSEPRRERILSIDWAGSRTAMVRLECSFFQKDFVDLLCFIRVEGQWRIISKVFHYESSQPAAGS